MRRDARDSRIMSSTTVTAYTEQEISMAKTSIAGMSTTKIRSTIFLTIRLFLLSLGILVAQDGDQDSGRYMLFNAQYGTEHRHVDVTNRLRELARHDMQFRVESNAINADPAPGRPKLLRVYAREGDGDERTFDFPDGSMFNGEQFRGCARADWGDGPCNVAWTS